MLFLIGMRGGFVHHMCAAAAVAVVAATPIVVVVVIVAATAIVAETIKTHKGVCVSCFVFKQ